MAENNNDNKGIVATDVNIYDIVRKEYQEQDQDDWDVQKQLFGTPNEYCSLEEIENTKKISIKKIVDDFFVNDDDEMKICDLVKTVQNLFSHEKMKEHIFVMIPIVFTIAERHPNCDLKSSNIINVYKKKETEKMFSQCLLSNLHDFLVFGSSFFTFENKLVCWFLNSKLKRNKLFGSTNSTIFVHPSTIYLTLTFTNPVNYQAELLMRDGKYVLANDKFFFVSLREGLKFHMKKFEDMKKFELEQTLNELLKTLDTKQLEALYGMMKL